jgi:broad specificity phosphatase PhoE
VWLLLCPVDDNIGTCKITFAELKTRKNVTMDLKMNTSKHSRDGKNPSLSFRLVRHGGLPTSPVKKEIFIVRHGQSKWNVAKSETHVAHMLQQYDHELTTVGIQQAEQFNARWKELKRQKDAGEAGVKREDMDDLEKFLSATAIFASPLTRATQTALLTCEDHPSTLGSGGITLLSNLREVKSGPGSFDTVGSHSGQGIATHVSAMLTRDMGAQRAKKVMVPLAHNDAVDEWWTPISAKDHKEDVSARFRELWSFLRYGCSDEVIVLVGHSSFFLRLMRDHMCPDFKTNNPEWADALATRKLDNGAGLRLSVEWSPHAGPMQHPQITNARLIFDTQLKKEKHKGAHSLPHEASVGSVELDMQ